VIQFDMLYWPLVANLAALAATFALFLYAMRVSLPLLERLGHGALICLIPFGPAIYVNMTYFVAVPLLFYPLMLRDIEWAGRVARMHYVLLVVIASTGPWALFLGPVPVALWLARHQVRGAAPFAIAHGLAFGVTLLALLLSGAGRVPAHVPPLLNAVRQLAYDTMRGLFAVSGETRGWGAAALTDLGAICVAICLVQAARRRPPLLIVSLVAGIAVLAGGVWRTSLVANSSLPQPWGSHERYFVLLLSTICLLALSVLSDALRSRRRPVIVSAAALLSLVLISANGIVNYSRPGLPDFDWATQVARAKNQQMREIPIPPGGVWTIRLP
jgi:hypothetical protein